MSVVGAAAAAASDAPFVATPAAIDGRHFNVDTAPQSSPARARNPRRLTDCLREDDG